VAIHQRRKEAFICGRDARGVFWIVLLLLLLLLFLLLVSLHSL
jgi:hypothetical protein